MPSFVSRARRRGGLVAVAASGAAALSMAAALAPTGAAQAHSQSTYLQPAAVYAQPLQAWSGTADGQTASPASYVAVLYNGSTASVTVHLISTNMPHATFQPVYYLDHTSWVWTGAFVTTDWRGTGSVSFTIDGLSAGVHEVAIDVNNTPSPGSTYYRSLIHDVPSGLVSGSARFR